MRVANKTKTMQARGHSVTMKRGDQLVGGLRRAAALRILRALDLARKSDSHPAREKQLVRSGYFAHAASAQLRNW
jgi:hypothetical protein